MGRHRNVLRTWLERSPETPDFTRLFFPTLEVELDEHPVCGLEPPANEAHRARLRQRFQDESLAGVIAASTHGRARARLLESLNAAQPFCLLLPDPVLAMHGWNDAAGDTAWEEWIRDALSEYMPVVELVRPHTFRLGTIDRLVVPEVEFPMVLELLVEEAHFVVLAFSRPAHEDMIEVLWLQQFKRSDSTIIVVEDPGAAGLDSELTDFLGQLGRVTDLDALRAEGPAALKALVERTPPRAGIPNPNRTLLGMQEFCARSFLRNKDPRSAILTAVATLVDLPELRDESMHLAAARLRMTLMDALVGLPGNHAALAASSLDAALLHLADLNSDEARALKADLLLRRAHFAALTGAPDALQCCAEARNAFAELGDESNVAGTYLAEGAIRTRDGDLDGARVAYTTARDSFLNLEQPDRARDVDALLARLSEPTAQTVGAQAVFASKQQPAYMGYFPPVVDGTLQSLVKTAMPGDPEREAMSVGALAEQRFRALDALEGDAIGDEHEQAVELVQSAVAQSRPFGLYLRNFALGATATYGGVDPYGTPQVTTEAYAVDRWMQRHVAELRDAGLPVVAIANRATFGSLIPSLMVSNQAWEAVAQELIEHAGAIVVFFLTSTPGVVREIDLIRRAGARDRTLLVVADEDPRASDVGNLMATLVKREREELPERTPPPNDFPHQVMLCGNDEDDDAQVAAALAKLAGRARPSTTWDLLGLPTADRPPREALAKAHASSKAEFDTGMEHFNAGEGVPAEDALVRSIAFSHWARDPLGRAMGFLMLAHVERKLLKFPNEAVACYFQALNLFRSLASSSETAAQAYGPTRQGLNEYLVELGDERRAAWVLEHYAATGG